MTSKDCRRCTYLSSSKSRLQLSAEEFDDRCALVQRYLCQASLSRLLPNTKVLCSDAVSSRSCPTLVACGFGLDCSSGTLEQRTDVSPNVLRKEQP